MLLETSLADDQVHQTGTIEPVFNTTLFGLIYGPSKVVRLDNSTRSWVWHKTSPSEVSTESSDLTHHVWRGDCHVKVDPAALNTLNQIIVADEVCSGLFRNRDGLAVGEHRNPNQLADAVGKHSYSTYDLISVSRIGTGPNVQLDGFVELRGRGFFYERNCFTGLVKSVWLH